MFCDRTELEKILHAVRELRDDALKMERASSADIEMVQPDHRASARNLLHYLGVRQHDVRRLQEHLAALGLSSLGSIEAHTLASLEAVLNALHRLAGSEQEYKPVPAPVSVMDGPKLLAQRTRSLLGEIPAEHSVRIMVTMPLEAASNVVLCESLLRAGMDVARINCAHDTPDIWLAMIRNLRDSAKAVGRPCLILADLPGPKLRTGPIEQAKTVSKIRPKHQPHSKKSNRKGATPAQVLLARQSADFPIRSGVDAKLVIDGEILDALTPGDKLRITDVRGKKRALRIIGRAENHCIATAGRSIHATAGSPVRLGELSGRVRETFGAKSSIRLFPGDTLIVTGPGQTGRRTVRDDDGNVISPAMISCSLATALSAVKPGDAIWFDDGKIGGRITECDDQRIVVTIDHARTRGTRLRAEKGINLPETDLGVRALTTKDKADLEILAPHVDLIGSSFVREAQDVIDLQQMLQRYDADHTGIVLKIENRQAFEHLPSILLASLRSPPVGIMVARGDLAVEIGYERLAEVQEEILWLCEAAHVPVVWATQVLEDLAKTGTPSRAEVTDAASGGRAECVMLNKGPYIVEAVSFLSDVLRRMAAHQDKKSARSRRLSVSTSI